MDHHSPTAPEPVLPRFEYRLHVPPRDLLPLAPGTRGRHSSSLFVWLRMNERLVGPTLGVAAACHELAYLGVYW